MFRTGDINTLCLLSRLREASNNREEGTNKEEEQDDKEEETATAENKREEQPMNSDPIDPDINTL